MITAEVKVKEIEGILGKGEVKEFCNQVLRDFTNKPFSKFDIYKFTKEIIVNTYYDFLNISIKEKLDIKEYVKSNQETYKNLLMTSETIKNLTDDYYK